MAGEKQTMAPPNTNITRQLYFQVVVAIVCSWFAVYCCGMQRKRIQIVTSTERYARHTYLTVKYPVVNNENTE